MSLAWKVHDIAREDARKKLEEKIEGKIQKGPNWLSPEPMIAEVLEDV